MDIVKTGSVWLLCSAPILDVNGARLTGLTDIKCSVRRYTSGAWQWLDTADATFRASPAGYQYTMTAVDATKTAGVYAYALDTSTITNAVLGDQLFIDIQQTSLTNAVNANQAGGGVYGYVVDKVEANLTVATSTLATPTNITAGTMTTVTNLTNAPTNGDLTATMKASVTTAATAATPTAAAVTGAVGSVAAAGITSASLATSALDAISADVWDEVLTGATHNITNSAGRKLREIASARVILTGTASAGTANSITLTGGSATDHIYRFNAVVITAGTGAGQTRTVLDYVGSSKVATVGPVWTTTPDNTSEFSLTGFAMPAVIDTGTVDAATPTTVQLNEHSATVNNRYVGMTIVILSGTGAGQSRLITAYVGATLTATVSPAWDTTPDTSSAYLLIGSSIVDPATGSAQTLAAASLGAIQGVGFTAGVDDLHAAHGLQATLAVPGSAMTLADDAITAAKIAAGTIGASEAPLLANLDVAVSTRLAAASYTAPPSAMAVSAQVAADLAGAHGAGSWVTADISTLATSASLAAVATDATKARRALWNRRTLSSAGLFTLYADDAVTALATATVTDKDGAAITLQTGEAARSTALV